MSERTGSRIRGLTGLFLALLLALFVIGCGSKDTDAVDTGSQEGAVVSDAADEAADGLEGKSRKPSAWSDNKADEGQDAKSRKGSAKATNAEAEAQTDLALSEEGSYTSKDEVAWYLHTYGHLPPNYITKSEAQDAGWKTIYYTLGEACPGKSIGGDRFGNREKRLPVASGRRYFECDIDYRGKARNAKRLIYSNDGLIFYTDDHYETFERLY